MHPVGESPLTDDLMMAGFWCVLSFIHILNIQKFFFGEIVKPLMEDTKDILLLILLPTT